MRYPEQIGYYHIARFYLPHLLLQQVLRLVQSLVFVAVLWFPAQPAAAMGSDDYGRP